MTDLHGRKLSPRLLPTLTNEVDFTSLDYQDVDVFLSSFSSSDKAQVTKHMTKQLKSLRGLLALSGQLATGIASDASLDSIIETTAGIINAERIFVLDIDHQHGKLVVRHSLGKVSEGMETSSDAGIEESVISQKKGVVVNDFTSSPSANIEFYQRLCVGRVKNMIAVPIVLGDTAMGLMLAFNKQADDFNFTKFDLSCLETIAVNMAVIVQLSIYSKMRPTMSNLFVDSPTSVSKQCQMNEEVEAVLMDIIDDTYRLLGADRVSIFVNNGNQELLCVASQDIVGAVVPASSGFVGMCFSSRMAFNIASVKNDKRHCRAVDERSKYETSSLLCVPLIGLGDEVLGVMQALNKKFGEPFSPSNELLLQQLAHRVAILLSRLKSMTQEVSNPSCSIVRRLGEFSSAVSSPGSLSKLMEIAQSYAKSIANCDQFYLYSSAASSSRDNLILERKHAAGGAAAARCQGTDIHPKVKEAIMNQSPTEIYVKEGEAESAQAILPGLPAKTALVIPLISFDSSLCDIIIVTRSERRSSTVSFSTPSKPEKMICLDNVFKDVPPCYSSAAFTPLESQALISYASIFNNALHLHAHSGERLVAVSGVSQEKQVPALGAFDAATAYSSLCASDKKELENLFDWHFNVLNIKDKAALHYAVVTLFDKEFNFGEMNIKRDRVLAYILEIDRSYLENPFHNFYHAVCVTHFDYMLLNVSNAKTHLTPCIRFASLLSALVHDVAHPGNTNMFEINMRSDLAILYNDTSVLENHHCSTAFRLMNKSKTGVFDELDFAERAEIRKMMIACIIATDMHYHVSLIELISNRASQEEWKIDNFTERMNYGKILLHAADLSNPTRVFTTSRAWAERVSAEFNEQGKNEKAAGIPVSTFLLSHDLKSFVKNELFFSGHIVFPMWKELVRLYPNMSHITDQISINLESWKNLLS